MATGIATLSTVPMVADLRLVLEGERRDVQARAHRRERAEDHKVPVAELAARSRWRTSGSAHGTAKYIHQQPNVRPTPAMATSAASTLQPASPWTTAFSDATVPMITSPSVMISSRP